MDELVVLCGFVGLLVFLAWRECRHLVPSLEQRSMADLRALSRERAYRHEPVPDWGADDIYSESA